MRFPREGCCCAICCAVRVHWKLWRVLTRLSSSQDICWYEIYCVCVCSLTNVRLNDVERRKGQEIPNGTPSGERFVLNTWNGNWVTRNGVSSICSSIGPSSIRSGLLPEEGELSYPGLRFSHSVVSDSLQPHESQHVRPPCPSPTPRVYSNSCPLSWWCHPTISSSVVPFSCLQSFPASGSFPMSQFFTWGVQSIGVSASASVLPMNIQDWFPLGWTGWISLQCEGLSRVFSNTTVQKHQFFGAQFSL